MGLDEIPEDVGKRRAEETPAEKVERREAEREGDYRRGVRSGRRAEGGSRKAREGISGGKAVETAGSAHPCRRLGCLAVQREGEASGQWRPKGSQGDRQ